MHICLSTSKSCLVDSSQRNIRNYFKYQPQKFANCDGDICCKRFTWSLIISRLRYFFNVDWFATTPVRHLSPFCLSTISCWWRCVIENQQCKRYTFGHSIFGYTVFHSALPGIACFLWRTFCFRLVQCYSVLALNLVHCH